MKKTISIIMALLMFLSFASCKGNESIEAPTSEPYAEQPSGSDLTVKNTENASKDASDISEETTGEVQTSVENIPVEADPSKWTDEEIVAFYKAAAIRSKTKVKSTEYKNLKEMVVNDGDGLLGTLVDWATPFLIDALEDSQVEFDGITGGYENLEITDAQSAKAYKSGEYTVIEMTMKEQTDGIHGDRYGGTVGHAISVVGDISSVEEALPMFSIDFENADIRLSYTKPVLKVKINKDGIIEKGTWSYTIKITVSNLLVAAVRLPIEALVESAHGEVDYVITVGGGF